jgi:sensor c-di-GMP phosphodiesterase-like protein
VRAQQCAKGQGYLFSRPLTSSALMEWLRTSMPAQGVAAAVADLLLAGGR